MTSLMLALVKIHLLRRNHLLLNQRQSRRRRRRLCWSRSRSLNRNQSAGAE